MESFSLTLLVFSSSGPPLHLSLFLSFLSSRGPWSPVGPFSSPGPVRLPALSPALTDGWTLPVGAVLLLAPDRDSCRVQLRPASPACPWPARQGGLLRPYISAAPPPGNLFLSAPPPFAPNPSPRRLWSRRSRARRRPAAPPPILDKFAAQELREVERTLADPFSPSLSLCSARILLAGALLRRAAVARAPPPLCVAQIPPSGSPHRVRAPCSNPEPSRALEGRSRSAPAKRRR